LISQGPCFISQSDLNIKHPTERFWEVIIPKENTNYLAICPIFRDEAPYLAGWISFHQLVDVGNFYLYDSALA